MPEDGVERVRQRMRSRHAALIAQFDESEYRDNMSRVKRLFAEKELAVLSSLDLQNQIKELESQIRGLELKNQRLDMQVELVGRKSSIVFALSLLATVLVGIGVNVATSTPYGWTGWVMIAAACVLEGIAFLTRPSKGD